MLTFNYLWISCLTVQFALNNKHTDSIHFSKNTYKSRDKNTFLLAWHILSNNNNITGNIITFSIFLLYFLRRKTIAKKEKIEHRQAISFFQYYLCNAVRYIYAKEAVKGNALRCVKYSNFIWLLYSRLWNQYKNIHVAARIFRHNYSQVFYKRAALKKCVESTTLLKKRLRYKCFTVKMRNFWRKLFCRRLPVIAANTLSYSIQLRETSFR